jgi:hypothetical protein
MLNPLMLLGLLWLGVPTLIHLINRHRMRSRPLATLQFLDQLDVANTFAPVPRDVLQLLLRLLLLTLFVILMARLTAPSSAVGPRALAIVLDNSMSMKRVGPDGKTSLFEQHRARILDLVRGMKQGDFFSFTLAGDQVFDSTGFTSDRAALERAVTNAWVSDGSARGLYPAIEDNLMELRSRRAPNTAFLVFSDQQTANYQSHPGSVGLGTLLRGSSAKPVFIQDPIVANTNIQLESAEFMPDRIYLGASAKVIAQVRNASDTQQVVTVSLKSGPVVAESRTVNVASGETACVDVRQTFDTPNDTAWNVNLSDDGFNADNDVYAGVRMLKPRQVLMVVPPDHYPKPDALTVGTNGPDLFACAVNPSEATGEASGQTHISVKRVGPADLERKALSMYSMVVLYGLHEMAPEVVQDLATYVRQKGGVYIIPDTSVRPGSFNRTFEPLLGGIEIGDLREPKIAASLGTDEKPIEDPVLLGLMRGEWGTVNDLSFARYFELKKGKAMAALRTRDGDVLLAIAAVGKGLVCVQAHSWNVQDTSLPRNLSFVSAVHAIINRLSVSDAEAVGAPDRIRAGDLYRMNLPQFRGLGGKVIFEGPRPYAFDLAAGDSGTIVRDMYVAGAYRATHPGRFAARDRWLVVNGAREESDASFMSEEQLSELCGGRSGVAAKSDQIEGLFRPRRELTLLLLALVFAALLMETAGPLIFRRKKESNGSRA